MLRTCKVYVVNTDLTNRLTKLYGELKVKKSFDDLHFYIVSDDKPKPGNFILNTEDPTSAILRVKENVSYPEGYKKIIAAKNNYLTQFGVYKIEDSILQKTLYEYNHGHKSTAVDLPYEIKLLSKRAINNCFDHRKHIEWELGVEGLLPNSWYFISVDKTIENNSGSGYVLDHDFELVPKINDSMAVYSNVNRM